MTGRAFDPGPPVAFAWAGDWLESYRRALETGDGDLLTSLFDDDGELVLDPFMPALVGANAIRAYLLDATAAETQLELTVERHWVSGPTILAAWHATFVRSEDRVHVRQAGFLTAEIRAERCTRLRRWAISRAGGSGS
jgi:ketosteroid isomerase-like protein